MATDSTSGFSPTHPTARRSSSRSEGLLDGIFARGGVAADVGDDALLQAMLDVEAALARAWARAGVIPVEAAGAIAGACRAERYDVAELAAEAARNVQPVVGLVAALRREAGPAAAPHVHHGATSQDVLDTAMMLVARRALTTMLGDLRRAADACAVLAREHAATPMIGRTLLQQAAPTTFGLRAAAWMTGLDEATDALSRVCEEALAVQLGGPVGALDAPAVVADVARQLDLAAPVLSWHAVRRRPAELAAALGVAAGVLGKIARDVALLAQTEVGEVREGGDAARGGSSSMAHKRNPVAAVSIAACAERVPGLVATMLGAMAQEHERAAGAWQAEWETLPALLRLTGSAAAWAAELTSELEVDAPRMAANLAAAPGDADVAAAVAGAAALARRALDERGSR